MVRSSRQGAVPSEYGEIVEYLNDLKERIERLEAPAGVDLNNTVARLQKVVDELSILVDNIDQTLTDFIANDVEAIVDARIAIALASYFAGNISIGGSLLVNGDVIVPGAVNTNLSSAAGRTVAWLAGPGDDRLGHT